MRILVYGINYFPELTGIGKYSSEMVEWLVGRGHDVRIVTAPPYYPAWKVESGYSSFFYRREILGAGSASANSECLQQTAIYRCPLWVPERPNGIKRVLHLVSFALSSAPVVLLQVFWRPSLVIVIEPPLMCAPAALALSFISRCKSWLHVQDFEVDAAFELGLLPASGWLHRMAVFIEKLLMKSFSRVSTISPNMLRRLLNKGVKRERALLFPNWVDIRSIYPLERPSAMRVELGIGEDAVVALYSGNMGEKQGLEILLETAQRLADRTDIRFVLCGDGAAKFRLQKEYDQLMNVLWLPLQPIERLNELLNCADIHLLPQRADASDLVMPSKLTGMLASGRPVIATAQEGTQVAEVVSKCGLVVPPGDVASLGEALNRLATNHDMRNVLGAAARTYAEERMGRDAILESMETSMKELE